MESMRTAPTPERPPFFERHVVRVVLGIAIAMTLLGAAGAWYLLGSSGHPLTVDRALDRFRGAGPAAAVPAPPGSTSPGSSPSPHPSASPSSGARAVGGRSPRSSSAATASHSEPAEGVYVFDTQGSEHTDALSGQTHTYPSQTTMTIEHAGCGQVARWQPLSERWDESEVCKTVRGVALHRFSMYHEFFHRGTREDFACGSNAIVMPWKQVTGDHWSFRCHSAQTTLDMGVRVVGFEQVPVGGKSVRAVHIRYEGSVTGADQGTQIQDRWLSTDVGMFLRITSSADVMTSTSFGRFHYTENYRLDLTSTSPRR